MLKDTLGVDDKDLKILSMFMANPEVSQIDVAKQLKISQPSVNVRIHKLKKKGLLSHLAGIELNKTNMYLTRVDFTASNAEAILNEMKPCSFFVNGFIMSGTHNASMFVVAHNLKKIETILNKYLRSNPEVKDVSMAVVVSAVKPFICALDLEKEQDHECQDPSSCEHCQFVTQHHSKDKAKKHFVEIK